MIKRRVIEEGSTRLGGVKNPPKTKRPGPPPAEGLKCSAKHTDKESLKDVIAKLAWDKRLLTRVIAALISRTGSTEVSIPKDEYDATERAHDIELTFESDGSVLLHNRTTVEILVGRPLTQQDLDAVDRAIKRQHKNL